MKRIHRFFLILFSLALCFCFTLNAIASSSIGISISTFETRYSSAFSTLGLGSLLSEAVITIDGNKGILTYSIAEYVTIVVTCDLLDDTFPIESVVFTGSGDGTDESGLVIFIALSVVVYACQGVDELSEAVVLLEEIKLLDTDALVFGASYTQSIGSINYSWSYSYQYGVMLTLEPALR